MTNLTLYAQTPDEVKCQFEADQIFTKFEDDSEWTWVDWLCDAHEIYWDLDTHYKIDANDDDAEELDALSGAAYQLEHDADLLIDFYKQKIAEGVVVEEDLNRSLKLLEGIKSDAADYQEAAESTRAEEEEEEEEE